MATIVTKSIGISGRDYSTIGAWEAASPASLTATDEIWIGECYNDAQFVEDVTIAGVVTDSTRYRKLTVAVGHRHLGDKKFGVSIDGMVEIFEKYFYLDWLRITHPVATNVGGNSIRVDGSGTPDISLFVTINHIFIHDWTTFDHDGIGDKLYGMYFRHTGGLKVFNCIIYNLFKDNDSTDLENGETSGIILYNNTTEPNYIYNCTIYRVTTAMGADTIYTEGIAANYGNPEYTNVKNCISMVTNQYGKGNAYIYDFEYYFDEDLCGYNYGQGISGSNYVPGISSLTDQVPSATFISITSGAEVLRLKAGSNAISAGIAITGFSPDLDVDICGNTRVAVSGRWDIGAASYGTITVTRSIGISGRDYSTLAAWNSVCPTNLVSADVIWKGECYNDGVLETPYYGLYVGSGVTTDSTHYIWLTAALSDRHTGKAGTGTRVYHPHNFILLAARYTVLDWLEFYGGLWGVYPNAYDVTVAHCIIHDTTRGIIYHGRDSGCRYGVVYRNIVYNCSEYGIYCYAGGDYIRNNTVWNCGTYGIRVYDAYSSLDVSNNVSLGSTTNWSLMTSPTTGSNNCGESGDTIPGTSSQTSTASAEFVDLGSGTKDLSLKAGAVCINNGADLGTDWPSGVLWDKVNIAIKGNTVSGTWDIGADEFVGVAQLGNWFLLQMKNQLAYPNQY